MSLPATIVTTRVTHTYYDPSGNPSKGIAIFKPDPSSLANQGIAITPTQYRKTLNTAGTVTFDLPTAVDGGSTTGVVYSYSLLLNGGAYATRDFLIPVTESVVDIETLVPVTPSPEVGRFVFPNRAERPTNPRPGEAFNNQQTGDTEYWNSVTGQWVGLSLTSGTPPVGPAGGVLSGTYPNPTLAANTVDTVHLKDASVTAAKLTIEYVTRISYLADLQTTAAALAELEQQITDLTKVLVLEVGQPVPEGTPAGTVIVRKSS